MTKIVANISVKDKDNLLILVDSKNKRSLNKFFDKGMMTFIKNALKNKTSHLVIPEEERSIFLLFMDESDASKHKKRELARRGAYTILSEIQRLKIEEITVLDHADDNFTYEVVEGLALGNYQFLKYFSDADKRATSLKTINVAKRCATIASMAELQILVDAVYETRTLVNEPQSYLTAPQLSKEIERLGEEAGFDVTVFGRKKIQELGMGGVIAVNQGSFTPPRFNILEWKPENAKNTQPIILVGKGIVYDTGGLSLKPTANSMDKMKIDMAGAATVIGIFYALAKAKLPLHVVGLIPATDNRPGNEAYAPGDVIKMYSGKTVEVLNTDAEGRMVLADALHYAKQYNPELVFDFATLTGSAIRAVGPVGTCFMGNATPYTKAALQESGERTYERLVEFPMWEEYGEMIKSDIADIKNIGGPYAGMVTAGKFLEHFVDYPWLHFDLSSAYAFGRNTYAGRHGTGTGIRLIYDFLKNR